MVTFTKQLKKEGAMDNNKLGLKIRELRKSKGYTQQKLAEIAGIDEKHLCRLENGKFFPKYSTLNNLLIALDANINDFMGIKFEEIEVNTNPIYTKAIRILNEAKNDEELNCYLEAIKIIQKTLKLNK